MFTKISPRSRLVCRAIFADLPKNLLAQQADGGSFGAGQATSYNRKPAEPTRNRTGSDCTRTAEAGPEKGSFVHLYAVPLCLKPSVPAAPLSPATCLSYPRRSGQLPPLWVAVCALRRASGGRGEGTEAFRYAFCKQRIAVPACHAHDLDQLLHRHPTVPVGIEGLDKKPWQNGSSKSE